MKWWWMSLVYIYTTYYKSSVNTSGCEALTITNLILTFAIVGFVSGAFSLCSIGAVCIDVYCLSDEEKERSTMYNLSRGVNTLLGCVNFALLITLSVFVYGFKCKDYTASRPLFEAMSAFIITQYVIMALMFCGLCLCICVPVCLALCLTNRANTQQGYTMMHH